MTAQYQLVMHSGPTPGKTFALEGDVLTIGREAGNTIVINDAEVSRKHAQLVYQGGKFIVTDIGSTNGTFVNGQRVTGQHVLQSGEIISLGEQINLLYEAVVIVDPNATVVSPAAHVAVDAVPSTPKPQPVSTPISAPSYAGQVPAGPEPGYEAAPPAKKSNMRIILIVVAVLILCILCSCIAALWYIDSNALWCSYFPFLFGGACG
jgi:hypothetical protein